MKRILAIIFSSFVLISILLSCGGKTKNVNSTEEVTEDTSIQISEIYFNDNWNKLDQASAIMTKAEYDSLNLGKLSFMGAYEDLQFEEGSVLINTKTRKLLTIKTISSGEISEYLLGYINNNITDSLLLAYEDAVEYFSSTASIIENNIVVVTTINFDYSGLDETSDTIVNSYRITPELTFDEIIEE